ncbi:unnamed protein product [Ranitomeya imitator]|uniref:DDE Tnp4 domain-containing protein n=1 Tax=Ranitomeya imitator TaxID=111125 RepID=A0ABN9LRA9_9NEOB|nr:unnamed protein product [Ranitomeya imitator]
MKLESIDSVVLACCVLHNFLRRRDALAYSPPGFMDSVGLENGEVQLAPADPEPQQESTTGSSPTGSPASLRDMGEALSPGGDARGSGWSL